VDKRGLSQTLRQHVKAGLLIFLVGTILCLAMAILWWKLEQYEQVNLRNRIKIHVENLAGQVSADLHSRVQALQRMSKGWETHAVTQEEFIDNAQAYMADAPGFQALEWVDKDFFVRWIVPLKGNEQAQDLSLASEQKRRLALEKAKATRLPTMTVPINLVQGGKGFLIYTPIFVQGEFKGFVLAVFRIKEWLNYVFSIKDRSDDFKISVSFDDVQVFEQAGWDGLTVAGFDAAAETQVLSHRLLLQARPTKTYIDQNKAMLPIWVTMVASLLSLLIVSVVYLLQKAHRAEVELSYKNLLMEAQSETTTDGILVVDTELHVIFSNKRLKEILMIPQHILDRKDYRLLQQDILTRLKSPKTYLYKIAKLINDYDARSQDEIEFADGRIIDRYSSPLISADRKYLGRIFFYNDITDRKMAEEKLRTSEALKNLLLENIDAGIAIIDEDTHVIERVNKKGLELFEGRADQVVGKVCHSFLCPAEKGNCPVTDRGQELDNSDRILLKTDGRMLPIMKSVRHIQIDGKNKLLETFVDITKRKRVEEELQHQTSLLNSLIDSVPDIIFYKDMNGIYLGCNPQFAEFVGRPRNEIVGKTDYDLFDKDTADFFREHDRHMLDSGSSRHNDEWISYPDGRKRLIDTLKTPYRGPDGSLIGVLGISRDITERKAAEEALQHVTDRLKLAVRAGGIGIWDYNAIDGTLSWDDQMFLLYDIAPENFSREYEAWKRAVHPEDMERFDHEFHQALLGEKEFDTEFRILLSDGAVRIIRSLALIQCDESGSPVFMIGTNWDISPQKQLEYKLRSSNDDLEKEIENRKKLERIKDEFISTVSHELRTPLAITREGIAIVLDQKAGPVTEKQQKALTYAQNNIDRLARLINDLLDFSKLEAGKIKLQREQLDIVQLIREIASGFGAQAGQKGLEMEIDVPLDPVMVYADRDRIIQVLTNLVSNALKFTEKGNIQLSVRQGVLSAICAVKDTGRGIEEKDLPKVFEKFQQFGRIEGGGNKGTGLGLAISKQLVELHGGNISIVSAPAKGTCITFTLPQELETEGLHDVG